MELAQVIGIEDSFITKILYDGCWCPVEAWSKGINSHFILFIQKYNGLGQLTMALLAISYISKHRILNTECL